jgi:hypothetical protein
MGTVPYLLNGDCPLFELGTVPFFPPFFPLFSAAIGFLYNRAVQSIIRQT